MNEILDILGLFIDFAGVGILLIHEYNIDNWISKVPDMKDRIENMTRRSKQHTRKNALILLMVGFIIQVIAHVLPPF